MQAFLLSLGALAALIAIVCVSCVLGAAGGALTGWIVSWFFDDTLREAMGQFGIHLPLWKFGAFLGFVGAFFRPITASSK